MPDEAPVTRAIFLFAFMLCFCQSLGFLELPGAGGAEDVSGRAFMSAWSALKSLFAPCGIPLDEIALK
jgi:hypothetical protein